MGSRPADVLRAAAGVAYGAVAVAVMWGFWVAFVVFLVEPPWLDGRWPLPTINGGAPVAGGGGAATATAVLWNVGLVILFGLQHSVMARPAVKAALRRVIHPAFERATYVHAANAAGLALVLLWRPLPQAVWTAPEPWIRDLVWWVLAAGLVLLLAGARSIGLARLLGLEDIRRWSLGLGPAPRHLETGRLYGVLRHPMYVGLLTAVWATPRMTLGHLLLAVAMTVYVLIGMRFEERDLARRHGAGYSAWRRGRPARPTRAP